MFVLGLHLVADPLTWKIEGDARLIPWRMDGEVMPVRVEPLEKGISSRVPRRPLAGWLMVYATLGPQGQVVPVKDRDGQLHEAAKELGHIDWTPYLEKGGWIDNHRWLFPDGAPAPVGTRPDGGKRVHVGRAHTLEFHDGGTDLSLAHRKIGYFTSGELYDREDPESWRGLGRTPTPLEFERAEHYWDLAHMLKGTPRPLAFSADGIMALSKDKARLLWARVDFAGVCEIPKHPATTAEPMTKASPLEIMEMAMQADTVVRGDSPIVRGALHQPNGFGIGPERQSMSEALQRLILLVQTEFKTDRASAERWVRSYIQDNPHEVLEALNARKDSHG